MTELREFVNTDWYGYAGAENFADGSVPQIAEWECGEVALTVIADKTGIEVEVYNNPTEDCYSFTSELNLPKNLIIQVAKAIIEDIENVDNELRGYILYLREHYPQFDESKTL